MARRMLGGVAAWLVSVLPLAIVNGVAAFGWVDVSVAAVVGALTLILGVVFGALTAGWIGGRAPDLSLMESSLDEDRSVYMGARGALWSGGLAGLLYALTMFGVLYAARQANLLPTIILQHPLRMSAAVISVACVLVGLSLLVGWYAGRQTADDNQSATFGARPGQPSQRLAQVNPPPRQVAPTRTINQPARDYADPRSSSPRTPGSAGSAAAMTPRERASADRDAVADWEGLPDLRGPRSGRDTAGGWDERAPAPPPMRRERR